MRALVLACILIALAPQTASAEALAGSWGQKSSVPELTLTPKLKIVPSAAASGFVAGSFGSGSHQLSTTIQNEFSSILTDRAMSLDIRADGRFTWIIDKSRASSAGGPACKILTHQEKSGMVRTAGDKLTFQISTASESTRDTCDPTRSASGARPPGEETYNYSLAGAALKLSGAGGVNWAFARR